MIHNNAPVSFIMPAYNCADTVVESVESIIQGNLEDGDELIIVNDGSTDGTPRVIQMLASKYDSIKILSHKINRGSAAASRNTGIENAQHQLLFCLDADNLLAPGSIKKLKEFLINTGADAAAFQELWYFSKTFQEITHKWTFRSGEVTLADALSGKFWPGPSGNYLLTKESWRRAGRYHEFVGAGIDSWGFGVRQLATGSKMQVLDGTGYYHRYGHESAWVRDTKSGNTSLKALQMLIPFLDLIDDNDVEYIMSRKGRYTWFKDLEEHPLKLKTGEKGRTGITSQCSPARISVLNLRGRMRAAARVLLKGQ